ncbi:MAG: hypothetical protein Q8Q50_13875 [Methylobacter sp.]|nr:hypothetical protein [Methylobacter sp.]
MNRQLLRVIEGAIRSDKQFFPLNKSWEYLHQHYNIGQTQGNTLKVTPQDKDELLAVVKLEAGIDLEQISVADFSAMNREAALSFALDEKIAGQSVKKDRLAIKALTGMALKINGLSYSLPSCGHLDMALADISGAAHNCILIIENYRCFDHLDHMQLIFPDQYADPLVLYRGDNYYSEKIVRQLLLQLDLPVLAMADLDLQGLCIAQSFPHIVGLIAPSLIDLEILLQNKQKASSKLYDKQLAGCQYALSTSPHALIRQLWGIMKKHQAGIVQEYWLQTGCKLMLHNLEMNPIV